MRNNIKKVGFLVILGVLVILGIPLLINYLLFQSWPITPPDLSNKEWLGFWASFLGSIIGGIATFIAVFLSLKQNEKFHEYQVLFQNEQERLKKSEFSPWIYARHYRVINLNEKIEGITINDISRLDKFDKGDFFIDTTSIVFGRDNVELIEYGAICKAEDEMRWIGKESFTHKKDCTFVLILLKNIGKGFAHKVSFYHKDQKLNSNDFTMQIDLNDSYPLLVIIKNEAISKKYEIGMEYHDLVNQRYKQNICITPKEHICDSNPDDIRKYFLVYSSEQI
jgi:hypothetical protein